MTQRQLDTVAVETVQGDIANQPDLDAIVNAANAELRIGGGVAGAIHRAAGPGLEQECIPLGPIRPGDAVISAGHNLPNAHVIHCLGPVYGRDEPAYIDSPCFVGAMRAWRTPPSFAMPARYFLRAARNAIPDCATLLQLL